MNLDFYSWSNPLRLRVSFVFVFVSGTLVDFALRKLFPNFMVHISEPVSLGFAPELWIGIIAIVLGTLIIVISIASQSTPKILSFFIGDYTSLLYNSCLMYGLVHSFYSTANQKETLEQLDSLHINALIFLPLAGIAVLPYTLYILSYTKKSRIIRIITQMNERAIMKLPDCDKMVPMKKVSKHHKNLLGGLNSLDDLFEYVNYREPKGRIVNSISHLLQTFIRQKKKICPYIFEPSGLLRNDITFQNISEDILYIKNSRTFYEFKCLHILSDAYFKSINADDYQLASLVGNEVRECGQEAIRQREDSSLEAVFVSMNTMIRFSLKHGAKHTEVRNTYNLLFHYSKLFSALIDANKVDYLLERSKTLCYYADEIYKMIPGTPSFVFLTDVLYLEFNNILMRASICELDELAQNELLKQYCSITPATTLIEKYPDLTQQIMRSNRLMKIKMALYYMNRKQDKFMEIILGDIHEDLRIEKSQDHKRDLNKALDILQNTQELFWEATDRGNKNIYYTPYKEEIQKFRESVNSEK